MGVVVYRRAVELQDHIARTNAGGLSRSAPRDSDHPCAGRLRHSQLRGHGRSELGVETHAEERPSYLAGVDQLPGYTHKKIDRDREADALVSAGVASNRRVDAD